MILIIDNYDSFTYNLYQYVGEMYPNVAVYRNDELTVAEIEKLAPEGIIISPGPGYPKDAGISIEVLQKLGAKIPVLGVCLGFQAIAEAFGGKIIHAKELMHGKHCDISIDSTDALFENIPERVQVARYHSLAAERSSLPDCLKVTAVADDNEIMAVKHNEYPIYGVQFHPEAVMTKFGRRMIRNFLVNACGIPAFADKDPEYVSPKDNDALKPYLIKVISSENLTEAEAEEAMDKIMSGDATNAQIGSFMTALSMKGETIEEITGFARTMRKKAAPIDFFEGAIDIVGTGGDLAHTFNISTATSFVVSGAGAKVAKHGNRSVSSLSGSADVLEALGVKIDMTPQQASECIKETGLCFMFAPAFHKSMRFAASPRKEIGVRSVFNILGPLANPAKAEYMLLGVYDKEILETMAQVLSNLGIKKALVVHGEDGLDEVTLTGKTNICEIDGGKLIKYMIDPREYGLTLCTHEDLKGGFAKENAKMLVDILEGERGPRRDIVVLNAGVSLYACGKASSIAEGIQMAQDAIDSGKAYEQLGKLINVTSRF